ncbi:hypothetical protein Hanom_Chr07g00667051 [Helianthus anomalus]
MHSLWTLNNSNANFRIQNIIIIVWKCMALWLLCCLLSKKTSITLCRRSMVKRSDNAVMH